LASIPAHIVRERTATLTAALSLAEVEGAIRISSRWKGSGQGEEGVEDVKPLVNDSRSGIVP
jgi:hypothetical protein